MLNIKIKNKENKNGIKSRNETKKLNRQQQKGEIKYVRIWKK